MKQVLSIFILMLSVITSLPLSAQKYNRDIDVSIPLAQNNIYITVPRPTVGIVGINQVSFGNSPITKIDDEIYEKFNGFGGFFRSNGKYTIILKIKEQNEYGKMYISSQKAIGTIDPEWVKKFESKEYFRGKVSDIVINVIWDM